MSKIHPNSIISNISGKLRSDEETYIRTNTRTGRMHVSHCPTHRTTLTERQRSYFASFGERSRAVGAWYRANRPSRLQPDGSPRFRELRAAFEAQHANGNFYSFVLQQIGEELMEQGIEGIKGK